MTTTMSFCYFHGIVPVSEGHRVQTVRSNGGTVWHTIYDTTIPTETDGDVDGIIRVYVPSNEPPLSSDSLVIINGKFAMPLNPDTTKRTEFIMESINYYVFKADPSQPDYDSFLPSNNVPSLNLIGNVVGSVVHMGDNGKAVDVKVSNYVQNRTIESIYRYAVANLYLI